MEESPISEMAPSGTSVATTDEIITHVIDRSSIGILLQTLAPHLTGLLSPPSAPQLLSVVPPTVVVAVPSFL